MKTVIKFKLVIFAILVMAIACTEPVKYSETLEKQAFFSYKDEGFVVIFTNESKIDGVYKWDFGDGTTSAEKNPIHNFGKKGKYVVTLTTQGTTTAEASTVILLDKNSKIKLDDATLLDWDNITKNIVVSGPDGIGVKKGKFDYDANYVYIYIEQNALPDNNTILDLFVDGSGVNEQGVRFMLRSVRASSF